MMLELIGMMVGKGLYEGILQEVQLAPFFAKALLGYGPGTLSLIAFWLVLLSHTYTHSSPRYFATIFIFQSKTPFI